VRAQVLDRPAPVESRPLRLVETAPPRPGPGELLIDVTACGICRTDLHVVEGELAERLEHVTPGHQIVGRVAVLGEGARGFAVGDRVGVAWLHRTCGTCRFCRAARENLCEQAAFTGWSVHGGYAESVVAPAEFIYRLPGGVADVQAAPLLCAGIIGYRALRLTGLEEDDPGWRGRRLGIYGFGAAGHVVIQLARARGAEVYVSTRDRERHQALASELGAAWVGGTLDPPPAPLDAAIVFAPAGEIVPAALAALDKGGTLVLGGIHMSAIPSLPYSLLYGERVVRSVANNTREDGRRFLAEATRAAVRTRVETFPLADANDALIALKHDAIRGAGVLEVRGGGAP
jgi:alcohol dehydrogenase, propanol-preferring